MKKIQACQPSPQSYKKILYYPDTEKGRISDIQFEIIDQSQDDIRVIYLKTEDISSILEMLGEEQINIFIKNIKEGV